MFATLAPSAMRMELTRIVSEHLSLPESLAERLLGGEVSTRPRTRPRPGSSGRERIAPRSREGRLHAGAPARRGNGSEGVAARERGSESERAFLALCIALPDAGAAALADLDLEHVFSGDAIRRAAAHVREHLADPTSGLAAADDELAALIAELVVEARRGDARPELLAVQRLQLELARLDREILSARAAEHGLVSELAERRAQLKDQFDRATTLALEEVGDAEL